MEVIESISGMVNTDKNLIQSSAEFDKAIDHIVLLIQDACFLYMNGSYSTSAFLSITACEEVAKAHIDSFTNGTHPNKAGCNTFRDHKTKHEMAALPTVPMGKRLEDAIGKRELQRITNMAHNAGFVQVRENSLYFQREKGSLVVPSEKVDRNLARSLALYAIEVFDDALVGCTNHSYEMDDVTDALFKEVSNA